MFMILNVNIKIIKININYWVFNIYKKFILLSNLNNDDFLIWIILLFNEELWYMIF